MTAVCEWGGELEVSLGIHREYPAGEWDFSEWDAATWEQTDTPLGDWLDVTCETLDGIRLAAGSSRTEGIATRWEAATAEVGFLGEDFDPRTGPWVGLLGPGLPVRIRWRPVTAVAAARGVGLPRDTADWSVVFQGEVANGGYRWDPMTRTALLQCVDLTARLVSYEAGKQDPEVGAHEFASARVHRIADLGRLATTQRDITRGGITLLASDMEGSLWSQLLLVADTDIALLWMRRDGRLAYRPQGRIAENVPITAVLEACPDDVPPPAPALPPNLLLNDDQASSESTMVWTAWSGGSGQTVARTTEQAAHGAWSVKATPGPASGYAQASPNGAVATRTHVTPGPHTVMVSLWEATAHSIHDIYTQYFDAAGAAVGTATTTRFTERGAGGWIVHRAVVTVPAGATRLLMMVSVGGFSNGRLTNQITNDFESTFRNYTGASANLTGALDATVFHGGAQSLRMERVGTTGPIQIFSNAQNTVGKDPIVPGEQVTVSCWVRHSRAAGATNVNLLVRFNLGSAGLQEIAGPVTSVPPNVWTALSFTTTAPANVDSVTFRVNTASNMLAGESLWLDDVVGVNDSIVAREVVYLDRAGVFAGDVPADAWSLPSYVPPPPSTDTPVGYVDLLHKDMTVVRNFVSITHRKPEGAPSDPPTAIRVDDASISRFGPVTYRRSDLEHDVDSWSGTVAELVLADGAWPTSAPAEATFDSRTHGGDVRIPTVLLGLEPEHVFTVVDPIDRGASWRMIAQGWDVDLRRDRVTGSIFLDDVTGWGTAAGWDDPAPPHGWDIDTWALSGYDPGGALPVPQPVTYAMTETAVDIVPPGAVTPLPLVDPFTGHPAHSFIVGAGTFSMSAVVGFASTPMATVPVRVAILVNGNEVAFSTGTTSKTAAISVSVLLPTSSYASSVTWELVAIATGAPAVAQPPTTLTITPG